MTSRRNSAESTLNRQVHRTSSSNETLFKKRSVSLSADRHSYFARNRRWVSQTSHLCKLVRKKKTKKKQRGGGGEGGLYSDEVFLPRGVKKNKKTNRGNFGPSRGAKTTARFFLAFADVRSAHASAINSTAPLTCQRPQRPSRRGAVLRMAAAALACHTR